MNLSSVIGHSCEEFEDSGIHQVFSGFKFAELQLLKPFGHVPFKSIGLVEFL